MSYESEVLSEGLFAALTVDLFDYIRGLPTTYNGFHDLFVFFSTLADRFMLRLCLASNLVLDPLGNRCQDS
jgi:hypothetical protein